MKNLVEYIAKGIVEDPDAVEVIEVDDSLIELRVADDDRGKVIGRQGRTAQAIRTLMGALSESGAAPGLDIVD